MTPYALALVMLISCMQEDLGLEWDSVVVIEAQAQASVIVIVTHYSR